MALNHSIIFFQFIKRMTLFSLECDMSVYEKFISNFNTFEISNTIIQSFCFFKLPVIFNTFLINPSSSILINVTLLIVGMLLFSVSILVLKKVKRQALNQPGTTISEKSEIDTKISTLKQNIEKQNIEIEELHKRHDQLIGTLAHDLKNPLNIIFHNLEDISNATTKQSLENASNLMMDMLQNVLDIQKYANVKIPIAQETFNLVDLISDSIQKVDYLTNKKNINIVYKSELNIWVNVDHAIILRVIVSLLINLIKHTPLNETIVIRSEMQDNALKLSICSTLDDTESDKIRSFFSTDKTDTQNHNLNALFQCFRFCALAISSHNENFGFEKDDIFGSHIWFTLPIINAKNEQSGIKTKKHTTQFIFTDADINSITLYVDEMRQHSIFELSKLKSIINKIPDISDGIVEWKEHVSMALTSMNEQRFIVLLDNASKTTINHEE